MHKLFSQTVLVLRHYGRFALGSSFLTALPLLSPPGPSPSSFAAVRALIERGAVPDREAGNGVTALLASVVAGKTQPVAALVRNGASPDMETKAGETALIRAALMGRVEAISSLVDAGATVDYINPEGCTALMSAARQGQIGSIRALW